jgi:hypothetical protein
MLSEIDDDDSATWVPESVIHHRVITKPRKRLMVEVTWKYHPLSWIDDNALQLQSPLLIVQYVRKNHLQEDLEFTWTKGINIDSDIDLRHINAIARDGPKYKFG